MDEESADVGDRIKQVRGAMKQQAFAEALGIGRTTLIRYESGERLPDADFILRLHVLYAVQPLWLLTGKGPDVVGERLTPREARLLAAYRAADATGQAVLDSTAALLAGQPEKIPKSQRGTPRNDAKKKATKKKAG